MKEKIDLMWKELEYTHNISNIVTMENQIENNKNILLQLFTDNVGHAKVLDQHQKVLNYKTTISDDTQNRIYQTNYDYVQVKNKIKTETITQKKLLDEIKKKHTDIMDLEERQKKLTVIIRSKKDQGY